MLKLDNSLLEELGLSALPDDQKRAMLQHIYDTLELRVGTNLANQMTDQQLSDFEKFIDGGGDADQGQALHWLETNLPNYKQVVNDVFEVLKGEIKQSAPQLVAASGASVQPAMPAPVSAPIAPQPVTQPEPVVSVTPQPLAAPIAPQPPIAPAAQPFVPPTPPQPAMQPLPPQPPAAPQYQPAPPDFQPPAGPGTPPQV